MRDAREALKAEIDEYIRRNVIACISGYNVLPEISVHSLENLMQLIEHSRWFRQREVPPVSTLPDEPEPDCATCKRVKFKAIEPHDPYMFVADFHRNVSIHLTKQVEANFRICAQCRKGLA